MKQYAILIAALVAATGCQTNHRSSSSSRSMSGSSSAVGTAGMDMQSGREFSSGNNPSTPDWNATGGYSAESNATIAVQEDISAGRSESTSPSGDLAHPDNTTSRYESRTIEEIGRLKADEAATPSSVSESSPVGTAGAGVQSGSESGGSSSGSPELTPTPQSRVESPTGESSQPGASPATSLDPARGLNGRTDVHESDADASNSASSRTGRRSSTEAIPDLNEGTASQDLTNPSAAPTDPSIDSSALRTNAPVSDRTLPGSAIPQP